MMKNHFPNENCASILGKFARVVLINSVLDIFQADYSFIPKKKSFLKFLFDKTRKHCSGYGKN